MSCWFLHKYWDEPSLSRINFLTAENVRGRKSLNILKAFSSDSRHCEKRPRQSHGNARIGNVQLELILCFEIFIINQLMGFSEVTNRVIQLNSLSERTSSCCLHSPCLLRYLVVLHRKMLHESSKSCFSHGNYLFFMYFIIIIIIWLSYRSHVRYDQVYLIISTP